MFTFLLWKCQLGDSADIDTDFHLSSAITRLFSFNITLSTLFLVIISLHNQSYISYLLLKFILKVLLWFYHLCGIGNYSVATYTHFQMSSAITGYFHYIHNFNHSILRHYHYTIIGIFASFVKFSFKFSDRTHIFLCERDIVGYSDTLTLEISVAQFC